MKILITGGAGFIGSTIASALIDNQMTPIIVDNLVTGRREFVENRIFYHGDISDKSLIDRIFSEHQDIYAVIHCAALIIVPDSAENPLIYYQNNVAKAIDFVGHLIQNGCKRFIFSSSASIYDSDIAEFVDEQSKLAPSNPYSRTKMLFEYILEDFSKSYDFKAISLRYFNPIGADLLFRTGLQTNSPTHALGKMIESYKENNTFYIRGTDWPTRDGTTIRDYIHVWDLAMAHFKSVEHFDKITLNKPYEVINLGTGNGTTVRELLDSFQNVIGKKLKTEEIERRLGDFRGVYTKSQKAFDLLDWKPQFSLQESIKHSLKWMDLRNKLLANQQVSI